MQFTPDWQLGIIKIEPTLPVIYLILAAGQGKMHKSQNIVQETLRRAAK